jgi:hypothetical protein
MSIFRNNDIDTNLLDYLDLIDGYIPISLTNKYYYKRISNSNAFKLWKDLHLAHNRIEKISYPNSLFISACRINNPLFTYLIKKFKNPTINIHTNYDCAFRYSCENGHLNVAQSLINLSRTPINIHANREYAFRYSCGNGHLNVAQWLINLCTGTGNPIYIHACDDWAFRQSCKNDHLYIAQWLFDLSKQSNELINVKACGLWALSEHRKSGYVCKVEWLVDLVNDRFHFE